VAVCKLDDLLNREGKQVELQGCSVAMFRCNRRVFAIQDQCIDKNCLLSLGTLEKVRGEAHVRCPRHRYFFNLETGECLQLGHRLPFFPCKIEPDSENILISFPSED